MTRMYARRTSKITVQTTVDKVLFGVSLPSDTVIHDIRLKMSCLAGTILTTSQICAYAVEAWILPVQDPDTALTYELMWDQLVPKDTDNTVLDLDTHGTDTSPMWEPGMVDFGQMFDIGLRPERIYHRHRFLDQVTGSIGLMDNAAPPTALNWQPGDRWSWRHRKRLRIRQPSALVFGFASPTGTDTLDDTGSILTEPEWFQVKYINHTLERAMLSMFGLTESGAETPFEEATVLLAKYLDPDFIEDTAGQFLAPPWEVLSELGIDLSVPGDMPKGRMITGGR